MTTLHLIRSPSASQPRPMELFLYDSTTYTSICFTTEEIAAVLLRTGLATTLTSRPSVKPLLSENPE